MKTCTDFDPTMSECCAKCHSDAEENLAMLMFIRNEWQVCCNVYSIIKAEENG